MKNFETISYAVKNRVAYISLSRPETKNAISQAMRLELKKAIDISEENDDVRVVVIRAEGSIFSSGTDLSEGLAGYDTVGDQLQEEYKPVLMSIGNSNKPYIASVQGVCAGIGASIAMNCDLAIMSDDAFLYIPFAGLSLVPDGGACYHLVNTMGYKKAYQLFIESGRIPASECLSYGFVNKLVSAEELIDQTKAWAERLAEGAPLAQKFGKHIMRQVGTSSFEEIVDLESKTQTPCTQSQDSQTAISAFLEKKKVVFIGK